MNTLTLALLVALVLGALAQNSHANPNAFKDHGNDSTDSSGSSSTDSSDSEDDTDTDADCMLCLSEHEYAFEDQCFGWGTEAACMVCSGPDNGECLVCDNEDSLINPDKTTCAGSCVSAADVNVLNVLSCEFANPCAGDCMDADEVEDEFGCDGCLATQGAAFDDHCFQGTEAMNFADACSVCGFRSVGMFDVSQPNACVECKDASKVPLLDPQTCTGPCVDPSELTPEQHGLQIACLNRLKCDSCDAPASPSTPASASPSTPASASSSPAPSASSSPAPSASSSPAPSASSSAAPSASSSRAPSASPSSSPVPVSPSPSRAPQNRVEGSVDLLGVSEEQLDEDGLAAFEAGVARRSGTTPDEVEATNVEPLNRKQSTGVKVDFVITPDSPDADLSTIVTSLQDSEALKSDLNTAFAEANTGVVVESVANVQANAVVVDDDSDSDGDGDDGTDTGLIAGVVVGSVIGVGAIGAGMYIFSRRNKHGYPGAQQLSRVDGERHSVLL